MTDKTKLLPCPFCGSSVIKLYEREALAWVACLDCGLEAPTETGVTKDQAIAYWNTRAMPLQEDATLPVHTVLLADINKAAHAPGTNASVRDVLQRAHRAIRKSAPAMVAEEQTK